jgi:hypothetical protein
VILAFILMKVFAMHGCFGPYRGVVLDKDTGKPIEGVVVMATYRRVTAGPGGTGHLDIREAQETVTDEDGEFLLWPENVLAPPYPQIIALSICWWESNINIIKPNYYFMGYPGSNAYHNDKEWHVIWPWVRMTVFMEEMQNNDPKALDKMSVAFSRATLPPTHLMYKTRKFLDFYNAEFDKYWDGIMLRNKKKPTDSR